MKKPFSLSALAKQSLLTVATLLPISYAQAGGIIAEPMNWWVGMQSPNLQILLRGDDVGKGDIKLQDYPGVVLKKVTSVDSPNYAFIDLTLSEHAQAGTLTFTITEPDGDKVELDYDLLTRRQGSAERQSFSQEDVIYLINPDRFANGDTTNDVVDSLYSDKTPTKKDSRYGGDLTGIINNLEYLDDLGITQIWLTPPLENNQKAYSYHGYAATDFYNIDARFGSNEQFKEFSQKAEKLGIGIIWDVVLNHSGSEHWWNKDKPTNDWLNFDGKFSGTTHARTTMQDIHASNVDRKQFNDGWFVPTMPDLNQRQQLLANYITQNNIWWVEYANLSGIRVDTYSYSDKAFLSDWAKRLTDEYPNLNIVGEEWTSNPVVVSYWQKGKVNTDGYVSHTPSMMDFALQENMVKALNESEEYNSGWINVYESMANDFLFANPDNLLVFADNHDMGRIATQLKGNLANIKMAMALTLTQRGIPQMYYGTEILANNDGDDSHGAIRMPFPGGFADKSVNAFTGEGLSKAQVEMQSWMRTLLNYRQTSDALINGKMKHFRPENGIYVYFRYTEKDKVMVILNKNDKPIQLDLSRFAEALDANAKGRNLVTNEPIELKNFLTLNAAGPLIIQL